MILLRPTSTWARKPCATGKHLLRARVDVSSSGLGCDNGTEPVSGPGRQGVVLAPRAVQRLQVILQELFGRRARPIAPRHRGARLPDQGRLAARHLRATAFG